MYDDFLIRPITRESERFPRNKNECTQVHEFLYRGNLSGERVIMPYQKSAYINLYITYFLSKWRKYPIFHYFHSSSHRCVLRSGIENANWFQGQITSSVVVNVSTRSRSSRSCDQVGFHLSNRYFVGLIPKWCKCLRIDIHLRHLRMKPRICTT